MSIIKTGGPAARRRELVEAERRRQRDRQATLNRLRAELATVREHLDLHRQLEEQASRLSAELDGYESLDQAERAAFRQALAAAGDPRLVELIATGRRELAAAQHAAPEDAAGHLRAAALLEAIDRATRALADPAVDQDEARAQLAAVVGGAR